MATPIQPKGTTMIEPNMSNEAYHAEKESISNSGLSLMHRSPAHFRYQPSHETTRPMEIGTAIHTAILEPDLFNETYLLLREVPKRTLSAYKEAIKTHDKDKTMTGPETDHIVGMKESVSHCAIAHKLLTSEGNAEMSIFTTDPITGVKVKARLDWLTTGLDCIDLKKTQDAREHAFANSVARYRYYVQQAFYSDVYFWETGEQLKSFRFLAVEEKLPHAAKLWDLDTEAVNFGRKVYRENLNTYAECLSKDEWPAYDQEHNLLALPAWCAPDVDDDFVFDSDEVGA